MATHFQQEDTVAQRIDTALWLRLFRFSLQHKRLLIPLVIAAVTIAAIDASIALVTRGLLDDITAGGREFWSWAALYGGMSAAMAAMIWLFIVCAGGIANHLGHDIRGACFRRLQELEIAWFDERPTGWILARVTADCDRLARIVAWGFLDLVWALSLMSMIAVILLVLDWRLGLIVLAIVPPLLVVSRVFQRRILTTAREVRKWNSQITAAFNEAIQGVRTTKTLVREEENLNEFRDLSGNMFRAAFLNARQSAFYYPVVFTMGSLAAGLALWQGGVTVLGGALTLGTLVAFMSYAGQFFFPINQLAHILAEMQGAQAAGERVLDLLDTQPRILDAPAVAARIAAQAVDPRPGLAPDGLPARIESIEFRDVGFAYKSGTRVLDGFNLRVHAGDTIALVGPSGGGKTTIVSLLCRFYEPTSGGVLVNGTDYRERGLRWYQSQMGMVLQTPHLFAGTIRDNIRYGRLDATDAEVEEAARLVRADVFIRDLEKGYDTDVGEGGGHLSTGQRQLVSFARAVLARPQILVMDEATASIDTETEQLIQAGLERVLEGRIGFVIAHRLSTIRRATRILVIRAGRIEESGTHAELLRQRGHYWELYTNQFRREREEEVLTEGIKAGP